MSEERFARIETTLDDLSQGQDELRGDVSDIKTDLRNVKADVGELKADVSGLKQDFAGQRLETTSMKQEMAGLRADVNDLKTGQIDLRRHMGVLHEEVLDRIQALVFDPEPRRREFQTGIADLREELVSRIEPLEAAARRNPRE